MLAKEQTKFIQLTEATAAVVHTAAERRPSAA
jgi:hypothetical protein